MRKELLPALSSLLFLCVLLESTSLLLFSTRVGKKYLPGLWSMDCDASWRSRWEMRHVGKMLPDPYKYDVYDPHRGWALKPSLADLRLPKGNTLTTNSKGTRGAKEYRYGKSEKQRILILGDSFTFGEDVSDKETYSHYLQEMLPFTEVINFGVHGYGHDQMLLYLKEEGLKYKPDLVILGFVDQDMSRNLLAFRDYSKPKYELAHSGLVLENYPVPPPEAVLGSGRFRPGAVDLLVILYYGLKHRLGLEKKETEEITAAILNELAVQARNMGAIPLFIHLPVGGQMARPEEGTFLQEFCRDKKIAYGSLDPYFLSETRGKGALGKTKHWSAGEHYLAARAIRKFILPYLGK